ncbi:hypothetical protein ES708_12512 [subsurface metagenome]
MEVLRPSDRIMISDLNGDGMHDILHLASVETGGEWYADFHANYSNGIGFIKKSHRTDLVSDGHIDREMYREPIDINGDGKAECIVRHHISYPLDVIQFRPGEEVNLVKQINNGLNKEVKFNYATLAEGTNYTRDLSVINYPEIVHFNGPLYVVSSMITTNGVSGNTSTSYTYSGAKTHQWGRGFLGFSELIKRDYFSGIITTTSYDFDSDYYITLPTASIVKTTAGDLISTTTFTSTIDQLSGGTLYPYNDYVEKIDHILGAYSKVDFNYDNNGNAGIISTLFRFHNAGSKTHLDHHSN